MDTPHIAVIDDDDSVREAMKHLISVLGYSVNTFASAEAFLNSSQRQATTCVITDVQMPGMSGIELHRRLLACGRRTPVIFLTAYPDKATRNRVIRDGAIAWRPALISSILKSSADFISPKRLHVLNWWVESN